jgi:hypothetical protein
VCEQLRDAEFVARQRAELDGRDGAASASGGEVGDFEVHAEGLAHEGNRD